MRIISELKLDFNDVLIRPKRSTLKSRQDVDLNRTFAFVNSNVEHSSIPIFASNMDTTGTFEIAVKLAEQKMVTALNKHYTIEQWENHLKYLRENNLWENLKYYCVSTGIANSEIQMIDLIFEKAPMIPFIMIDVANGYTESFVETVKKVRQKWENKILIAGNVVTGEMTEELILAGADIVKVGIGSGSVCTTRTVTGVGYPQLSAIIECADAAHGLKGHIIADGGCVVPGDIVKAFGAGADFVMLGGMFSGYDESGGELVMRNGVEYKKFYGMSSKTAMIKHTGDIANYKASEGKEVLVPYKGMIYTIILQILGGLRSACTYVGASKLKELSKRTTFVRVNNQTNDVYGKGMGVRV